MRYLFFVVLILSGCTTTYVKPGASNQEFNKVKTDCIVKTKQAYPGLWNEQFMRDCMAGEGWSVQ